MIHGRWSEIIFQRADILNSKTTPPPPIILTELLSSQVEGFLRWLLQLKHFFFCCAPLKSSILFCAQHLMGAGHYLLGTIGYCVHLADMQKTMLSKVLGNVAGVVEMA